MLVVIGSVPLLLLDFPRRVGLDDVCKLNLNNHSKGVHYEINATFKLEEIHEIQEKKGQIYFRIRQRDINGSFT